MKKQRLLSESGMTLIEMMVALTIFSLVVAGALGTLRSQSMGYRTGADRMTLLQNLRFAANTLEQDLRVVGANVPDQQPYLIYGGVDVIAFSGDYVTNVEDDPFAVYYDPDAPNGTVTALTRSQRITIPNSTFAYPDSNYTVSSGVNSPAETLIFFFTPDSSTSRTDDYALFRQVNSQDPELVSRNLLKSQGADFFEYFRLFTQSGQTDRVIPVPTSKMPMVHSADMHLSTLDTGAVALIDSVRGVRVRFTTTNGRTGADEQTRELTRLIRMPNAGLATKKTCGDTPLLGTGLNAFYRINGAGDKMIRLRWNPAIDENGGEQDVVRYSIWRIQLPGTEWGDPLLSIPAGSTLYIYDDETVVVGQSYRYALAAQDCTPSLSGLRGSPTIAIP